MPSARDDILRAIRQAPPGARPGAGANATGQIDRDAAALLASPGDIRPALGQSDPVAAFVARVIGPKVGATLGSVPAFADLPKSVARLLAQRGLPPRLAVQPAVTLTALDWAGAGLSTDGPLDEGVAVGLARWGIAETGSLVFHSAPDMPILMNFLPATHIVAVRAADILAYLEDYAVADRASGLPAPRNAGFVTGASGTADIEGRLVMGAHGPGSLHVVVVGGPAEAGRK